MFELQQTNFLLLNSGNSVLKKTNFRSIKSQRLLGLQPVNQSEKAILQEDLPSTEDSQQQ